MVTYMMLSALSNQVLRLANVNITHKHYWLLLRLQREHAISCQIRNRQDRKHPETPGGSLHENAITNAQKIVDKRELDSMKSLSLLALQRNLDISVADSNRVHRYVFLSLDTMQKRQGQRRRSEPDGVQLILDEEAEGVSHHIEEHFRGGLDASIVHHILHMRAELYESRKIRPLLSNALKKDISQLKHGLVETAEDLWRALQLLWQLHPHPKRASKALCSMETFAAAITSRAFIFEDDTNVLNALEESSKAVAPSHALPHIARILGSTALHQNTRLLLIAIWRTFRDVLVRAVPAVLRVLYQEIGKYELLPDTIYLADLPQTTWICELELHRFITELEMILETLQEQRHHPHKATIRNALMHLVTVCAEQASERIVQSYTIS